MEANLDSLTDFQKRVFLIEFTHELIRNSGEDIFKLKEITDENPPNTKHLKHPLKIQNKNEPIEELKKEIASETKKMRVAEIPVKNIMVESMGKTLKKPIAIQHTKQIASAPVLRIPEPKLPQRFEYLKPTATTREIDLGKLNLLVQDPMVRNIECNGPSQNVTVIGTMGTKKTNIILNRDEIDDVIERFSREAKIPVHEGVFKVVLGKMIFSSVISNVIGSRFIIRKMNYNPNFNG